MVSFESFVKSMTPSLLELKVTPSFCFAFKIPDDPTATSKYNIISRALIFTCSEVGLIYKMAHFADGWQRSQTSNHCG